MKRFPDILKKEKLVLALVTGLLLLVAALPVKTKKEEEGIAPTENKTDQDMTADDWQQRMEKRLAQVLTTIQGVGKTEVFLTCQSTKKKIIEKDDSDTVYEKDAKGNQIPYVRFEEYPKVTGVLIVAEGGGNAVTRKNIREAVQALFQVEAHKIKVTKMNSEENGT